MTLVASCLTYKLELSRRGAPQGTCRLPRNRLGLVGHPRADSHVTTTRLSARLSYRPKQGLSAVQEPTSPFGADNTPSVVKLSRGATVDGHVGSRHLRSRQVASRLLRSRMDTISVIFQFRYLFLRLTIKIILLKNLHVKVLLVPANERIKNQR